MAAPEFPVVTLPKGTETVGYVFDFSSFPELQDQYNAAGTLVSAAETISSVAVTPDLGITCSNGSIIATATDGVPAGKGVLVVVSGGTVDTDYTISCRATTSGGSIREIRLVVARR